MRQIVGLGGRNNFVTFTWESGMESRFKYVQRAGLVSMLLIVGVLVGLMAALPAEAGNPTLKIDGIAVTLVQGGTGCGNDTGFKNGGNTIANSCYSVSGANVTTASTRSATLRVGNWYIGSVSSTNHARVLVNDTSTGTDNMKLTGVTFTSATNTSNTTNTLTSSTLPAPNGTKCALCQEGHVVVQNSFTNAPNPTGNYMFGPAEGGYFAPPTNENTVNNRFRLIPTGCFVGTSCTPSTSIGTLDTGAFSSPITLGALQYVTKTGAVSAKAIPCNGPCTPTIKYDYVIWVQGKDALYLTDSVSGCGGTCQDPPCVVIPEIQDCADQSTLACTIKGGCTDSEGQPIDCIPNLTDLCTQDLTAASNKDEQESLDAGAIAAQTCIDTCIVISVNATPIGTSQNVTFPYTATGLDVANFSITTDIATGKNNGGQGAFTFSNLTPDTNPNISDTNDRTFTLSTNPPIESSKGKTYTTQTILCDSQFNDRTLTHTTTWVVNTGSNSSNKISLTVRTIAESDILICNWHEQSPQ